MAVESGSLETPPFRFNNQHAVNLCLGLVAGTVRPDRAVCVSACSCLQPNVLSLPSGSCSTTGTDQHVHPARWRPAVRPARGEYSLTSNPHGVEKTIGTINNNDFGINSEHGEQRRATI